MVSWPDALFAAVMIVALLIEMLLFGFLCLIGRFYQLKFGQKTYYYLFALPLISLLITPIFVYLQQLDVHLIGLIPNLIAFIVLIVAGRSLYKKMTGVSR